MHFVRSASPYYEIQTNHASVPFSPVSSPSEEPRAPENQEEGRLSETLSFVQRTCALTCLGTSFLGFPSEVNELLGGISQGALLGEVVLALRRYISQRPPTAASLEREAGTAPFTEDAPSSDDEEEEPSFRT